MFEALNVATHLTALEAEAIFIVREAVGERQRPVLLFSGGKDSIVLLHIMRKAFFPGRPPVSLLHVDTGHNFPETIAFRDATVAQFNLHLQVASVEDEIRAGRLHDSGDVGSTRNFLQTPVLLKALRESDIDLAFGGARRDEEKARAKERIFSHRNRFGQWEPKNQRPELWSLYMTCTGAVRSSACSLEAVLTEVLSATTTERGATRSDDRQSAAAMEERKKEGYF